MGGHCDIIERDQARQHVVVKDTVRLSLVELVGLLIVHVQSGLADLLLLPPFDQRFGVDQLTDETRYMIDGAAIGRMKPGVMLINTGRGQLIHTEALIEGLKEKKIGAAGLDVYEEEAAYFYEDTSDRIMDDDVLARLLSFNNVVMTSHQGFFTREALDNIAHITLQNINDFAEHRELRNEVRAEPEKTMN